nr:immunoglobulin light chain junction region [Macaca mulatta]MOY05480.1 immunoglobulin light chain junction region [Macaca mulatta]MOY06528.1 immunoglobulin light chain junction region [Macaca mulatta]MOY06871.1 immunoglobulin light chain junction region [Macaca mulatta]MOY08019.1 immunoglobulin light chain junction region [Macaca mulatta]
DYFCQVWDSGTTFF